MSDNHPSECHADVKDCRSARCRSGMTITEILVITAIILVLLGLGVACSIGPDEPPKMQTRTILAQARTVVSDYLMQSGQWVNHRGTTPFDWETKNWKLNSKQGDDAKPNDGIERFLVAVTGNAGVYEPTSADSRAKWAIVHEHLAKKYLADTDADGFLEIVDVRGRKLEYYTSYTSSDGTKHPQYSGVFFVSAGADGQFGTKDDIYSYQVPSGK